MLDDEKQWDNVLSGKNLPAVKDDEEHDADSIRQYLIWRKARRTETQITSQQAQQFYQHVKALEDQRYPKTKKWLWWLIGVILLVIIGATTGWYYLNQNTNEPAIPAVLSTDHLSEKLTQGENPIVPEMMGIPKGTFIMGCNPGWDDALGGCLEREGPAHMVDISAFEMARNEVTVKQFKHFVEETNYISLAEQKGENTGCTIKNKKTSSWDPAEKLNWRNPGFPQTDSHPVTCIAWEDTQHYLQWLNKKTGNQYRLPTEKEWEYAARGGKATAFYWGSQVDRSFANYVGIAETDQWEHTAPVGQLSGNDYGLHDMSGNVWEWVEDCWRENYRQPISKNCNRYNSNKTRRGGSWDNFPPNIRHAYRSPGKSIDRSYVYGFRIAHDAMEVSSPE